MPITSTDYVCNLDANGWQLYSFEGYEHLARAKRRAASLSKRLTKLVAKAKADLRADPMLSELKLARRVRNEMYKLMCKYSADGAADTEPECVLVAELEKAFGLDPYSVER